MFFIFFTHFNDENISAPSQFFSSKNMCTTISVYKLPILVGNYPHFTCLRTMWNFLDHRHQVWQSLWSPTLENLVKFCEKNKRKWQVPPFFTSFSRHLYKKMQLLSIRLSIQLSVRLSGASSASQSDSSLVSLRYPSSVRILFDFWVSKTNKKFV